MVIAVFTKRLRLSNAEAKQLDSMGHRWWRLSDMDEAVAKRRMYRLGAARYREMKTGGKKSDKKSEK